MVRPITVLAIDSSASMNQNLSPTETKAERANSWLRTISSFLNENNMDYQQLPFSNGLTKDSTKTDILLALNEISRSESYPNISKIVLISDGLHHNINDFTLLDNYSIPVFPVILGRSKKPIDISIKEVRVNNPVYLNTDTELEIITEGIPSNIQVDLSLFDGDKKLLDQHFTNGEDQDRFTLHFTPHELGYQQLSARISTKEIEEHNTTNNQKSFLLNVVKAKAKVTLITSSPNWDIAFIHRALQKNDRFETIFIDKRKDGYYQNDEPVQLEEKISESDVLILNNLDTFDFDTEIYRVIENFITKGGNILYTGKIDKRFASLLPLQTSRYSDTVETSILETSAMANYRSFSFPLANATSNFWNSLPPITTFFYTSKPTAEVLAKADIASENPVIAYSQYMQGHVLQFSGFGFYKWKMWQKQGQEWFDQLILNIVQWLLNADVSKRFLCSTNRLSYLEGENVAFQAYLFDEKMNPVNNQDILIKIAKNDSIFESNYMIEHNGEYSLDIQNLASGSYAYQAETSIGQRLYQDEGKFIIEDRTLEQSSSGIQRTYLEYIASKTGGSLIQNDEDLELLNKDPGAPIEITSVRDFELWKQWYLPILAIVLLALELILRKKKGLL